MSLAAPIASAAPVSGAGSHPRHGRRRRGRRARPGLALDRAKSRGSKSSRRCAPAAQAVDQIERANPDVVILDVEMPDLDGISALPLLLEKKRDLVVIMASTLTRRNAEVSLKALSLGAADYIPKPETNREVTTSATFRRDLIEKIRQLGGRRRRTAGTPAPRGPSARCGAGRVGAARGRGARRRYRRRRRRLPRTRRSSCGRSPRPCRACC